jgi:hypothetical protein
MYLLSDIITYCRRLIKSPSNAQVTDNLIIDYINRFWINDVDPRIQLFDLKTTYTFQTAIGIDTYNMPLYNIQTEPGPQTISFLPIYQGFETPAFVNGIQVPFYTQRSEFWNLWPNYVQASNSVAVGNGTAGPYTFTLPYFPALPGHIDITGIIATGVNQDPPVNNTLLASVASPYNGASIVPITSVYPGITITSNASDGSNIIVQDSGQFLTGNINYGLLMQTSSAPWGCIPLSGGYSTTSNTVNYVTGQVTVTFPSAIPAGTNINCQSFFYEQGIPRAVLFYNNTITIRPPPNIQYRVELGAYLTPAAFLTTSQSIQFGYMSEYIARGAARKMLSDTGDWEQFMAYEPLFKEQETLVWKRSQRQFTASRTGTIFSETQGQTNYNNLGYGTN